MHVKINILPIILGISASIITFLVFIQLVKNPVADVNELGLTTYSVTEDRRKISIDYVNSKTESELDRDFNDLIKLIDNTPGEYAFYIKKVSSDKFYSYNDNERFYAASLYKVPVAVATLNEISNGKLNFDDEIKYTPNDFTNGSGIITSSPYGTKYKVRELLDLLLKESDNSAQIMLKRLVAEQSIANAFKKLTRSNNDGMFYIENNANAKEIALMFESVPADLLNIMTKTSFDNRISLGLNKDTVFAHKIGSWGETGSWHDCGIILRSEPISPILVCLMSKNTSFKEFLTVASHVGEFVENIN